MNSRKGTLKRKAENNDVEELRLELDHSLLPYFNCNRLLEQSYCQQDQSFNTLSYGYQDDNNMGIGDCSSPRGRRPHPSPDTSDVVSLDDIGGLSEEINFLRRSVLYPLIHKGELSKWGFIPPKGIIFHGVPGTGKTLLAKAIPNELSQNMKTKVEFIYRKGTDCHSKGFGDSSKNLRKIFLEAQKKKPALIFFDEIDGLCPQRDSSSATSEVYASIVTTFLGMMEEIKNGEVFVIAATNRLDSLDPALRRPGRFDKELHFSPPDEIARKEILRIHTKKWKNANKPSEALVAELAAATPGFTGAYLQNLCFQASTCAINRYKVSVKIDLMTRAHLSQVTVVREDWLAALRQIGRPKTNSFGSVLYVPQGEPKLKPLISAQVEGIKKKIFKMIPFEENFNLLKSFLIYGPSSVASTYIIPALLNSKEFQKTPVYQMSYENISHRFYDSVGNIMTQVMTCSKPCILYMPNCDYTLKTLSDYDAKRNTSTVQFLVNKLTLTSNKPVLILATASYAPSNLPEVTRSIFPTTKPEHAYKLRVPNENERREFFQSVLDKKAYGGGSKPDKMWDTFFQENLEKCVKITEYYPLDDLIELHRKLWATGDRQRFYDGSTESRKAQEKSFKDKITNIIDNYRIIV